MQADHYSSQRLMMRPFKQTDSDALTLGLQEPLVSCQLANVPDDYQPQHAQQFIAAFGTPDSQNFALAICLTKRPQMLIGGFGVRPCRYKQVILSANGCMLVKKISHCSALAIGLPTRIGDMAMPAKC